MSRPFVGLGVPMVVAFGPADVGRRVTLRRRLVGAAPGEPSLGDVVGVLEGWSEGLLRLRKRSGELVEVLELTVVAGRVVAPERSAAAVARLADDTWRPRESEPLGEWRLRAHGGVTHRPNSVLAVGDPGADLLATAPVVESWYAARDLPANVITPLPSAVADAYRVLGWTEQSRTLVMSAALTELLEHAHEVDDVLVETNDALPEDWSVLLGRLRDDSVAPWFRELLTGTPSTTFATVRDPHGTPVAVARGAISDGWLNITNVEVAEHRRGERLAVAAIEATARWAHEQRATHAFLQLWPENSSAIRLYERLGFTVHHEYAYFVAPD